MRYIDEIIRATTIFITPKEAGAKNGDILCNSVQAKDKQDVVFDGGIDMHERPSAESAQKRGMSLIRTNDGNVYQYIIRRGERS